MRQALLCLALILFMLALKGQQTPPSPHAEETQIDQQLTDHDPINECRLNRSSVSEDEK